MLMAVIKAKFIKPRSAREAAKVYVRYFSHRPGRDNARITREIFGRDGQHTRLDVYEAIDKAKRGTIFYKIILSPDPKKEDKYKDLDLRELTEQIMLQLQNHMQGKGIQFFASIHADHTNIRHVHILALIQGRLKSPELKLLRSAATEAARAQRRDLDRDFSRIARAQAYSRTREAGRGEQTQSSPHLRVLKEPEKAPGCPSCETAIPMQLRGRSYECLVCGLAISRAYARALEAQQHNGPGLELSLGKEVGDS